MMASLSAALYIGETIVKQIHTLANSRRIISTDVAYSALYSGNDLRELSYAVIAGLARQYLSPPRRIRARRVVGIQF